MSFLQSLSHWIDRVIEILKFKSEFKGETRLGKIRSFERHIEGYLLRIYRYLIATASKQSSITCDVPLVIKDVSVITLSVPCRVPVSERIKEIKMMSNVYIVGTYIEYYSMSRYHDLNFKPLKANLSLIVVYTICLYRLIY